MRGGLAATVAAPQPRGAVEALSAHGGMAVCARGIGDAGAIRPYGRARAGVAAGSDGLCPMGRALCALAGALFRFYAAPGGASGTGNCCRGISPLGRHGPALPASVRAGLCLRSSTRASLRRASCPSVPWQGVPWPCSIWASCTASPQPADGTRTDPYSLFGCSCRSMTARRLSRNVSASEAPWMRASSSPEVSKTR